MCKIIVVYVIQKSNKYGLKQWLAKVTPCRTVVYVIQKSNKYGLKQFGKQIIDHPPGCVCHSKK